MDIIVVSHKRGQTWRFSLGARSLVWAAPVAALLLGIGTASFAVGYWAHSNDDPLPVELTAAWAQQISTQRTDLARTRELVQDNTQAIARRLAQLQAHVIRLDAAGQRLTEIADLDSGEFNFDQPPPIGGPETESEEASLSLDQILASLDSFEHQLSDRERQMRVLEDLLLASRLQKEVKPSGWPIAGGWISSAFGSRRDPFNGRKSFHSGLDFAGRAGADVLAVASGIVTDSASRFGYGQLVEINHGNGYVTRYGHNSKVHVRIGDHVRKGQRIASVGSTGRSTGPHVHFEVLLNGQVVNPAKYVQAAR